MVRFNKLPSTNNVYKRNGIYQQFIEPGAVRCPPYSSSVKLIPLNRYRTYSIVYKGGSSAPCYPNSMISKKNNGDLTIISLFAYSVV